MLTVTGIAPNLSIMRIINPPLPLTFLLLIISCTSIALHACDHDVARPDLVKREHRRPLVETEYGEITAVEISDGVRGPYSLQFFTLEPNSLFLPALLHYDMVLYVHTGSGKLSWTDGDDVRQVDISRGDVYRLKPGSVFYVQSNLDPQRQKLRFYAIFSDSHGYQYEPSIGAYSRISSMITGFDGKVLQAAFKVPDGTVEEIVSGWKPPAIIHAVPSVTKKMNMQEWEAKLLKALLGGRGPFNVMNLNKRYKPFNIFDAKPDFDNCNGWSLSMNKKHLKGSNVGVFMVNLTTGSMMGPHWNPIATEVSVVLQGEGMVRVACPSDLEGEGCRSRRFKVEEGDVFVVPRFHPMAQISFNNDSFVFMGFSTSVKKNHPQFMAGKRSALQVVDRDVLAASLNVRNSTIDKFLASQEESIILDCTSCAEEEEMRMEEEIEKERREREEEEARKREEEEARKREEEEEARKREEEEEARKREEEEEARKREEEEEARKREEEEARKKEEEERKREEEEARKKEEEEARKREEEEAREKEEEEARKREEEEAKEKEEEEARKREEEEAKEKEEEEARKREEEAREKEEEEAREREEEASRKRREEEEAREREEEEAREKEGESEEEAARRQEEERVERERQEEEGREKGKGGESEEEMARRQEEERVERERQEEERAREREEAEGGEPEEVDVNSAAARLRVLRFPRFML